MGTVLQLRQTSRRAQWPDPLRSYQRQATIASQVSCRSVQFTKDVVVPQDLEGENVLRILPEVDVDWDATTDVLEGSVVQFYSNIATQSSHTGYALIAENLALGLIEPFAAQ